jgi:hypothetical protein
LEALLVELLEAHYTNYYVYFSLSKVRQIAVDKDVS